MRKKKKQAIVPGREPADQKPARYGCKDPFDDIKVRKAAPQFAGNAKDMESDRTIFGIPLTSAVRGETRRGRLFRPLLNYNTNFAFQKLFARTFLKFLACFFITRA